METKVKLDHEMVPQDRSASVDDLQALEMNKSVQDELDGPANSSPKCLSLEEIKIDNEINPERNSDDDKETRSSQKLLLGERSVDDIDK